VFKKQRERSMKNELLALWYDCKWHLYTNHVAKQFKSKSPTNLNRIRTESDCQRSKLQRIFTCQ